MLKKVPIFLCCIKIYIPILLTSFTYFTYFACTLAQTEYFCGCDMCVFFLVSCGCAGLRHENKHFPHGGEMVPFILANSKGLKDFNRLKLDTTLNLYHDFPPIPAILQCHVHSYKSLHRQCP